ncbi:MAG: ACT domain-containing protein [Roseiflexus sp.]
MSRLYDPRLPDILRRMRWSALPERYVLAGIDPRESAVAIRLLGGLRARLWQLFVAPDTITFILPEHDWRSISPAFPRARVERPYRVVSFEIDLPPDLTGFLAVISEALAAAAVPIVAISGFSRDHLLVREADLDHALAALDALVSSMAADG